MTAVGAPGRSAAQSLHPFQHQLAKGQYDNALVLLGANDLLPYFPVPPTHIVDDLMDHLKQIHATARSANVSTIAMGLLDHPLIANEPGGPAAIKQIITFGNAVRISDKLLSISERMEKAVGAKRWKAGSELDFEFVCDVDTADLSFLPRPILSKRFNLHALLDEAQTCTFPVIHHVQLAQTLVCHQRRAKRRKLRFSELTTREAQLS